MAEIKAIDPITAHEWLSDHEAILIDVREPEEYHEARIENAILIPLSTLQINQLPKNSHDKKIIFYCHFGKRSAMACHKIFFENQALNLYSITGGIVAWEDAGLKIIK